MTLKSILLGLEADYKSALAFAQTLSTKSIIRQLVLIALVVVVFFVVAPWIRDVAAIVVIAMLVWKIVIEVQKILVVKQAANSNTSRAPPKT